MNLIFYALVAIAFLAAAIQQVGWTPPSPEELQALAMAAEQAGNPPPEVVSPMQALTNGALTSAAGAVDIAISLIGGMALFLGVMKVAEAGGMMQLIARAIRPVMIRLFPDVPPDHPAMGAMILNMSANALGLGNAATPFGIQAMRELDTLNPEKGTATNAMALFLTINTSAVTLLPTGVMVIRERLGSTDPGGIFGPTLVATCCSTLCGILAAKLMQRLTSAPSTEKPPTSSHRGDGLHLLVVAVTLVGLVGAAITWGQTLSVWVIPTLIVGMLTFGLVRGVKVYEKLVEGAKEGFTIATMIIPYLVAILVAVGMLKSSGALDAFILLLDPITRHIGLPAEALPMALMRPLSGSGASGLMIAIMNQEGPDSYVGYLVSTFQGSTETTFYVLAVYFGAVQVKRIRHTLASALLADLAGILAAVAAVSWYLGRG